MNIERRDLAEKASKQRWSGKFHNKLSVKDDIASNRPHPQKPDQKQSIKTFKNYREGVEQKMTKITPRKKKLKIKPQI